MKVERHDGRSVVLEMVAREDELQRAAEAKMRRPP